MTRTVDDPWSSLPKFVLFDTATGLPAAIVPSRVTALTSTDPRTSVEPRLVSVHLGAESIYVIAAEDDEAASPVEAVARALAGIEPTVTTSRDDRVDYGHPPRGLTATCAQCGMPNVNHRG